MPDLRVFQTAFRSTPDACALLDPDGRIAAVNDAWSALTPSTADRAATGVGAHYLATCRRAARDDAPRAREAHRGLTDVMLRRRATSAVTYPCTAPGGVRWFRAEVFAVGDQGFLAARHVEVAGDLGRGVDPAAPDLWVDAPRRMTAAALDLALRDVLDGPPHPAAVVLVTDGHAAADAGSARADVVAHLEGDLLGLLVTAPDHHLAVRRADDVIRAASQAEPPPAATRWGMAARTPGDTATGLLGRARRMFARAADAGARPVFLDAAERSRRLHRAADDLVTAVAEYDHALEHGAALHALQVLDRAVLRAEQACVAAALAVHHP